MANALHGSLVRDEVRISGTEGSLDADLTLPAISRLCQYSLCLREQWADIKQNFVWDIEDGSHDNS